MGSTMLWGMFAAIGSAIAGFGFHSLIGTRRFLARAQRVPGFVAGLNREWHSGHDGGSTTFAPVLRFTTVDGRQVEAAPDVSTNPPPARPGQPVWVLYDPADPSRARVDNLSGRGTLVAVLLALGGLAFAVIGVAGLAAFR